MKNKRLWLSVTLTVLVVVCAMLILSRINETRSNAAPAAPTDLILPPDIQTTAQPDTKKYDDLPDVDISSWEYLIASQAHNISDYVPDVSKISGSQSTFDSRAVDALNALLKAARDAGWSPYIYCAYRPYLTQEQQYEDQVSENMRKGDTRDEAETAAARVAAPPGTSDHQTGLGADIVDQYYSSLSVVYDKDKRKSYQVKNVKIDISKSQNGITTIWLNNIHFKNFLKELWNTLQKTLDNGNWLHR